MTAGFIDLDVRYRNPVTQIGVALDSLYGVVKNATGIIIEEVTPDPYSDAEGAYYSVKDYDVRDASKFAGLSLTVDWIAVKGGIQLPTFSKQYDYKPVADAPVDKTVVYWDPPQSEKGIVFYEVYRQRTISGVQEDVLVGRSFGPSIVDIYPFADEFEARSWEYRAYAYERSPGSLQDDGSDYVLKANPIVPTAAVRTGLGVCVVEGKITNLVGIPLNWNNDRTEAWVSFFMDWRDRHSYFGDRGLYVAPEALQIPLATDGGFSAALLQDAVVTMLIEWAGLRARFVVPRTGHAFINELNLSIEKHW